MQKQALLLSLTFVGIGCARTVPTQQQALAAATQECEAGDSTACADKQVLDPSATPEGSEKEHDPSIHRSQDEILAAMKEQEPKIRTCYEKELSDNPKLEGTVKVSFNVAPRGEVLNVDVLESSFQSEAHLVECVRQRVFALSFKSKEHGTAKVEYPFVFKVGKQ